MRNHIRWLAAAGVAALGLAATAPAQAGADLAIGVTLGSPGYYYAPPPPPRYYESRVVYEEPVYYEERPRVVYEHRWCPEHHVYHYGPRGRVRVHYHHRRHDWDD